MSAIQGVYSINVSNRFDLGNTEEDEADAEELIDPLERLKKLEEQRERERVLKKQEKAQQAKRNTNKKATQFKENRDANITKKETAEPQPKNVSSKPSNRGPRRGNNDRQHEGDENRRPPRRRNDHGNAPYEKRGGGGGDRLGEPRNDQFPPVQKPEQHMDGDNRAPRRDRTERNERVRGGRGGFRGNGGQRNFRNNYRNDGRDDRGKREFDRRSGSDRSGVRPTDKRDGGGSRNWGTPGGEIEETQPAQLENEVVTNWADQVDSEEQSEKKTSKVDSEKEDEGDKNEGAAEEAAEQELTLDEWKALQNSNAKKLEFNIRKPGEGEDNAKWKNMKVLHAVSSKEATNAGMGGEDGHRRPAKNFVEVDIRFTDPTRGQKAGRGRGGGGGGARGARYGGNRGNRGNSGTGGAYNSRSGQQPPDVLNEAEFPTLPAA
uniref:Plasminogen activator inhibitor 1 RNA-binding protein n=1 Tax=Phallusia mammillata TaxID=59560 RepID=A0A6F9DS33_9ASCI|nr:plasminogen activator inhibitor 1 RNA-binding protein [Phallusia mammillata]